MRDSLAESSLVLWHPIAHGASCGRECGPLAESEQYSRSEHHAQSVCQPGKNSGAAPDERADRKRLSRSESVAHPSSYDLKQEIGIGKCRKDQTNLSIREMQLLLKDRDRKS